MAWNEFGGSGPSRLPTAGHRAAFVRSSARFIDVSQALPRPYSGGRWNKQPASIYPAPV